MVNLLMGRLSAIDFPDDHSLDILTRYRLKIYS